MWNPFRSRKTVPPVNANPQPNIGGNFWSYDGVRQSGKRTYWMPEDVDHELQYDPYSRQRIITDARRIYNNIGFIKSAVDSLAQHAVGRAWEPQFRGTDDFNDAADDYCLRAGEMCDARGKSNIHDLLTAISRSVDVDGEVFVQIVNAGSDGNWPMLLTIPAHRCQDNPKYRGAGKQKGGIVVGDWGRPIAYSFKLDSGEFTTVSASQIVHVYNSITAPDLIHGVSAFAHATAGASDYWELLDLEKAAVKNAGEYSVLVKTMTGEAPAEDPVGLYPSPPSGKLTPEQFAQFPLVSKGYGVTKYMLPAEGMEMLKSDRTGGGWFRLVTDWVVRDALLGLGVPYEAVVNPEKLNGTALRHIQLRWQRAVEVRQNFLRPLAMRYWRAVVSGGINRRDLAPQTGWWNFGLQMPRTDTVDAGREALALQRDYILGFETLDSIASTRQTSAKSLRAGQQAEVKDLLRRASEDAAEFGYEKELVLQLYSKRDMAATYFPDEAEPAGTKGKQNE